MPGRIRTVKPEWLDDERLAACSSDARVLSIALVLLADDYGNGRCHPPMIAPRVFPPLGESPEELARPSRVFREAFAQLAHARYAAQYSVDGQNYFAIRNWAKHQKVDHPSKPLVPGPPDGIWDDPHEALSTISRDTRETLAPDLRPRPVPRPVPTNIDPDTRETLASKPRSRVAPTKSRITSDWQPSQARLDAISTKTGIPTNVLLRQVPEFRLFWLPGGKGADRKEAVKRACDWDQAFSNRIDQLIEWGKLTVVADLPQKPPKPKDTRPPRPSPAYEWIDGQGWQFNSDLAARVQGRPVASVRDQPATGGRPELKACPEPGQAQQMAIAEIVGRLC